MVEGQEIPVTGRRPDSCSAAAGDLGRLITAVGLYPAGHPRIGQVMDRVLEACRTLGAGGPLVLGVTGQGLTVQTRTVDLHDRDAAALHTTLLSLGVASLALQPDIRPRDLQALAVAVSAKRAEVTRASRLVRVDLGSGLPASIEVRHRSFGSGAGPGASSGADRAGDVVRYVLEAAPESGDLGAAVEFVNRIVAQVVERVGSEGAGPTGPGAASRALDQVLDACAHAMRHAIEELLADGGEIGEIGKLAANVERAAALSKDRQAAEVLLDVLQLSSRELQEGSLPRVDPDQEHYELTLERLQERLAEVAAAGRPIVADSGELHLEQLSILLQLGLRQRATGRLQRIGAAIAATWRAAAGADRMRILAAGVAAFVRRAGDAQVDALLPPVMAAVCRDRAAAVPAFLVPICRAASDPAASMRLWPHVVNEILYGLGTGAGSDPLPGGDQELWRYLGRVGDHQLDARIKRLMKLDAVRDRSVARDVLDPEHQELKPVFARLLRMPIGSVIGPVLFARLRDTAARWPGYEAVLALPRYDAAARELLGAYLDAGPAPGAAAALREVSTRILLAELAGLPSSRRGAAWVPGGLQAVAAAGEPARPVLKGVLGRRFLLWPRWPAAARRVAAEALRRARAERRARERSGTRR